MAKKLYALLVGIDNYPAPLKSLRGCVNDVKAMEALLAGRVKSERLELQVLCDAKATRDGILTAFRHHLGQAGERDTALFFFGGHGSQEMTPALYAASEADGLSETLVAYDSRQPDGWDIADKEMAVLIAEVAKRGPHVVIILDSCHSGTATRVDNDAERRTTKRQTSRPAETYWFFDQQSGVPKVLDQAGGWRVLPTGDHVLLSSCRDFETARESNMPDGKNHGLFSFHLVEALQQLRPDITYRELHRQVQSRVNTRHPNQLPQAGGDIDRQIFDGAVLPKPSAFTVRCLPEVGWRLDAGAVHGIQQGSEFAILPKDQRVLSARLATVRATETMPVESTVELINGHIDSFGAWPAVLTYRPSPPLNVALEGSGEPVEALSQALATSPIIQESNGSGAVDVIVQHKSNSYLLRSLNTGFAMAPPILGGPSSVLRTLEQIARWQTIATLENTGSPLEGSLEMTLHAWSGPQEIGAEPSEEITSEDGGPVFLPYRNGRPGRFWARLRNHTQQPLFFWLFGLNEAYAVKILQGGQGRLAPGHTIWVRPGGIPASVPDDLHEKGVTQRRDTLILLISEVDTDVSMLEQGGLTSNPLERCADDTNPLTKLRALTGPPWHRELDEESISHLRHWSVGRRVLIAERPMATTQLKPRIRLHSLPAGIRLDTPFGFQGSLTLCSATEVRRRIGQACVPPPLLDHNVPWQTMALAGALGGDEGLRALEINTTRHELVTPETPLRLEAPPDIWEVQSYMAVAYNGRGHFLVGISDEREPRVCCIPHLPKVVDFPIWLLFFRLPEESGPDLFTPLLGKEIPQHRESSVCRGLGD